MNAAGSYFSWSSWSHGINLSVFDDAFNRSRFFQGLLTTLSLSVICVVLSIGIGIVGAWFQGVRSRLIHSIVRIYVQLFRNTPPLVQLYFFFFAVGAILPKVTDAYGARVPPVGSITWAIISFSLYAGAFNIEIFRSGMEAVPKTTIEAAEALGYSRMKAYRYVVFPLSLRICLPALGNNLVNLVKTTTLAYAIAVPELLYVSAQIWADELNVLEMMNILLVTYLLIVGGLVWMLQLLERKLAMPGYAR
jgi:polar amino acid transport system permease protein